MYRYRSHLWGSAAMAIVVVVCTLLVCPRYVLSEETSQPQDYRVVEMTLAEAISLALRTNRSVQIAYLDRVVQKFDLKVAEDKFWPDVNFDGSVKRTKTLSTTTQNLNRSETDSLNDEYSASVSVSETIPTGGVFQFVWNPSVTDSKSDNFQTGTGLSWDRTDGYTSSWQVTFSQPLLKGGGIDVNTASVRQARLAEKSNILSLKSTLISTVTAVINAYRNFLLAQSQVDISRASLERARELVEINKILIESGRMAAVELVQSEAEVANKEFSLEGTMNNFDRARLELIKVLDIPKDTQFVLAQEVGHERIVPGIETCIETAFANRPDYLQALLSLETAKINMVLAKNNRLWDLSANAAYGRNEGHTDRTVDGLVNPRVKSRGYEWSAWLNLQVPVWGDLTREQAVLSAQTSLKKSKINLKELKDNVETEVLDAVRDVMAKLKQVDLAKLSRELTEQKLRIEETKLKAGRSTNFQLVSFQNDLVNAQNNEIRARTDYRNALSSLDQLLGTTLDTWKIEFRSEKKVDESAWQNADKKENQPPRKP